MCACVRPSVRARVGMAVLDTTRVLDPSNEGKNVELLKRRINQWLGVEELKTEKDRKKELLLASKAKLERVRFCVIL